MILNRLRLTNFRGVADREITFPDQGVVVVCGPNEIGKSSMLEALDLLLTYRDRSTHRDVKAVKPAKLKGRLLSAAFEEWKGGRYKIISFYAKRARGLMSRYVIQNRIDDIEGLKGFAAEGYAFAAEASEPDRLVFRRREA